jgi:ubiquinone/menaquinone biosynthesis C-methylase UbiE
MSIRDIKSKTHDSSSFHDVDRSVNPAGHVNYLDTLAASFPYKRTALQSLNLRPGDRVLDVGCGTGDDARALSEIVGPGGEVVGLDASQTMISEAEHRSDGHSLPVHFQVGDAEHLPFPDDSFNAARADRVLQHLADPTQALREMARVTKSGGIVSVLDPDWDTLVVDVPDRALWRRIRGRWLERHPQRMVGTQLYRLFHEVRLADVTVSQSVAIVINDISLFLKMADLPGMATEVHADGSLTADDLSAWMTTLDELQDGRPMTGSIVVFGVRGTKP